jgi:Tfp pilus assembly protein PilW
MPNKSQTTAELKSRKRRGAGNEGGFSLVEFLIGSTITLSAVALSFTLLDQGQTAITAQRAKTTAQTRARKVLNLMTADIRVMGCTPTPITAGTTPGLLSATANSIRIVSDRTGNGTTNAVSEDDANDDVTYTFTNKTVLRSAPNDSAYSNTTAVLTNEISSMTIQYYDSSGIELVPPTGGTLDSDNRSQVARINILATIEIIEKGRVVGTVTVDNPIALRNNILD